MNKKYIILALTSVFLAVLFLSFSFSSEILAQNPSPSSLSETSTKISLDEKINNYVRPATDRLFQIIFFKIWSSSELGEDGKPLVSLPFIVMLLGGSALFFTFYFGFINVRAFFLSFKTVAGRYSSPNDPGEITHFQALSAAVSGTVGLGNIAGVSVAISQGGPGATFWLIVFGFLGMTTKFAECTLGVKYRHIGKDKKVHGGAMLYLTRGLAKHGLGPLGRTLAVVFATLCVGAALGGGSMFQVNQSCAQLISVTGGSASFLADHRWVFGVITAVLVGLVILGGITRIASVTSKLVPFMTVIYVVACLVVLGTHWRGLDDTFYLIFSGAFSGEAIKGGVIGTIIIGIRRAVFSNEAGLGSAPIAHSAVKTRFAASEGIVALIEPFLDTVIICTMTALVVIITGDYERSFTDGIAMTSDSFATVISWFPYLLSLAVILFALSTTITWAYYGLESWLFLFGRSKTADMVFKLIYCLSIIIGASMSLDAIIDFADGMFLGMCLPNLIGIYILLPEIKKELKRFLEHTKRIDSQRAK